MINGTTSVKSTLVETNDLMDMLEGITPNSLVFLDLDFNVLYYDNMHLGSDPWVKKSIGENINAGLSVEEAVHKTISLYSEAVPKISLEHVKVMQPEFVKRITELQDKHNIHFIVLTSRNCDRVLESTFKHIEHIGLNFNKGLFADQEFAFKHKGSNVILKNGVIMVSGSHKGECAVTVIEEMRKRFPNSFLATPEKIDFRFSDDSLDNVKKVQKSLNEHYPTASFQGYRNGKLDTLVASIESEPEIANIQAEAHYQILPSSDAKVLLDYRALKKKSEPCLSSQCKHPGQVSNIQCIDAGQEYGEATFRFQLDVPQSKIEQLMQALADTGIRCNDGIDSVLAVNPRFTPSKDLEKSNKTTAAQTQERLDNKPPANTF